MKMNLVGAAYGRLTVAEEVDGTTKGQRSWLCLCQCGDVVAVQQNNLRSGRTTSCGCLQRERTGESNKQRTTTHGRTKDSIYVIWRGIVQRCTNPNSPNWKYYGERGVQMCERWRNSFEDFLADMGDRPDGRTIDRINPNGNYEPGNCRWATWSEQRLNQRRMSNV